MKIQIRHSAILTCMVCLGASIIFQVANARKIKTKHSLPKLYSSSRSIDDKDMQATISIETDSLAFHSRIVPAIRFYGFDKTVTSNQESFFVSNGLDSLLTGMDVMITYTDMKGRQLHKRSVKLECDIPPHETKRIDVKSWDTQRSFYYHKSVKPKRQATPFEVSIELLSVSIK